MQDDTNLPPPWQVLGRQTLYTSKWINLHADRVRLPDGSIIEQHHVLDYPRPAVGVVAVDQRGQVILVDHYRFITRSRNWEIPAGGIDSGENQEEAARRELLEESGCTGGELSYLGQSYPSNGSSNQLFIYYFARGVIQSQPVHDTNEIIEARWFTPQQVDCMIKEDQIRDGLTLSALLLAFHKGLLAGTGTTQGQ